jgi:hypothetical protein
VFIGVGDVMPLFSSKANAAEGDCVLSRSSQLTQAAPSRRVIPIVVCHPLCQGVPEPCISRESELRPGCPPKF